MTSDPPGASAPDDPSDRPADASRRAELLEPALQLVSRQLRAADVLFDAGLPVEAVGLLREASARIAEVDAGCATSVGTRARLEAALGGLPDVATAAASMDEADIRRAEDVLDQARRHVSSLRFHAGAAARRGRLRTGVRVAVAMACGLLVLGAARAVRDALRLRLHPTATGTFHDEPRFSAGMVVDGRPDTEWLGRDGARETLTLRLSRASTVRSVRVVNGRNLPYRDRATAELEFTAYAGPRSVFVARKAFRPPSDAAEAWQIPVRRSDVTSCTLRVLRHHGIGAALAEVEVQTD